MAHFVVNLDGERKGDVFLGMGVDDVDSRRFSYALHVHTFRDHGRALDLEFDQDDILHTLTVFWADRHSTGRQEFLGDIVYQRRAHLFSKQTVSREVTAVFGPPYWESVDEDERLLFYEFWGYEFQFEFDPFGRLMVFTCTADPILSDPVQRHFYGLDEFRL